MFGCADARWQQIPRHVELKRGEKHGTFPTGSPDALAAGVSKTYSNSNKSKRHGKVIRSRRAMPPPAHDSHVLKRERRWEKARKDKIE